MIRKRPVRVLGAVRMGICMYLVRGPYTLRSAPGDRSGTLAELRDWIRPGGPC